MIRALLAAAVLALLLAAPAAAAPPGDWTYLRKDAFRHWACKSPGKGDRFQVRTATLGHRRRDRAGHRHLGGDHPRRQQGRR